MRYNYQCIRENLSHENIGEYLTYTIVLEHSKIRFTDITTKVDVAKAIVKYLNHHQVSPVHVLDVLNDLDGTT